MWIESEDGRFINLAAAKSIYIDGKDPTDGKTVGAVTIVAMMGIPLGDVRLVTCRSRQTAELIFESLLSGLPFLEKLKPTISMKPEEHERWMMAGKPVAMLREMMGLPVKGGDGDLTLSLPPESGDASGVVEVKGGY